MDVRGKGFGTKAVHAGQSPDPETGALVAPLFLTSTYIFTPEKMERYLAGDKRGIFTYGRSRNPTQNAFQEKMAALEGGAAALATGSGMAAIALAIMSFVHSGDHIISTKTVYGGTYALYTQIFVHLNIDVTFVDSLDAASLEAAVRPNTKLVYMETIANPTLEVTDIPAVVQWAKEHGITTMIDNTFASPYLVKPIELGVDIVVHSTTKYINGHGDHIGGVIVGPADYMEQVRSSVYQELGPVPSPFACWLFLRGLKTLHLRMERHCTNALALAQYLEKHPKVEGVVYSGLESHPQHELAKRLMPKGFGGMVTFTVDGGIKEAQAVINSLKMAHYAVSLGDCDTLVEHPATMTHGKISPTERLRMGIPDGLIRVSAGIEDPEDIISDFDQALARL